MRLNAVIAGLLLATQAHAINIVQFRCDNKVNVDAEAYGRIAWIRKCNASHFAYIDFGPTLQVTEQLNAMNPARKYYPAIYNPLNNQPLELPVTPDAACYTLPDTYVQTAICQAGCFTPDQLVYVEGGYRRIDELEATKPPLVTLRKDATLDALTYTTSPMEYVIKSLSPETVETILVFVTEDGGELKVTAEHQLVDGDGHMRRASAFAVGDALVRTSGERARVVSIRKELIRGRVYHVAPESDDELENVIVAQGFLSGSHKTQIRALENVNRLLLRTQL